MKGIGKSSISLGPSVFSEERSLSFVSLSSAISIKCPVHTSVYFEALGRVEIPVFLLEKLEAGDKISGPAIIIDGTSTVVVNPGVEAKVTSKCLILVL